MQSLAGGNSLPSQRGVVLRAIAEVLDATTGSRQMPGVTTSLSCQYVEIYLDKVTDLVSFCSPSLFFIVLGPGSLLYHPSPSAPLPILFFMSGEVALPPSYRASGPAVLSVCEPPDVFAVPALPCKSFGLQLRHSSCSFWFL
jgi:hypothetical protein